MARGSGDRVLDVLVYAPVGLALQLREDASAIIESGRTEVANRVKVARWVGEMAVHYGRRQLVIELERRRSKPDPTPSTQAAKTAVDVDGPRPEQPFDGYDTLAAAQLMPLLERLPHGELHMVRDYEAVTRSRRTVLAKIDQLLAQ
jgi:hypothetical protein